LLLGPVLGTLPAHLFQQEVLRRLGPTDLASLSGAGRGCAAAVAATALMRWARRAKMTPPEHLLPRYLRGFQVPLCFRKACSYAAYGGDLDALEWLHDTGCPWTVGTTCAAAGGGHLEVVKWLHNSGCPWDVTTCAYAAEGGHLRVLQWARKHHCPWNFWTPTLAARGGHLAVLQWAREHGCPFESRPCIWAAQAGQLEVLQWMRVDGDAKVWNENDVRRCAAVHGKQEVLTWLDELSEP
jgi:hypothetical protein